MALKWQNKETKAVSFNNKEVKEIVFNGLITWEKPYTLNFTGDGVSDVIVTRTSTKEPSVITGTLSNGSTIYNRDEITLSFNPRTGYINPYVSIVGGTLSNNKVVVSNNISFNFTSRRISGTMTISTTLPEGVKDFKVYRKPWDGTTFSQLLASSNTIYYGDEFYFTALPLNENYGDPTIDYPDVDNTYTWTGNQGETIEAVAISGLYGNREQYRYIETNTLENINYCKCYRKIYNGSEYEIITHNTIIYQGDKIYWDISYNEGYTNYKTNIPTLSNPLTVEADVSRFTYVKNNDIVRINSNLLFNGSFNPTYTSYGEWKDSNGDLVTQVAIKYWDTVKLNTNGAIEVKDYITSVIQTFTFTKTVDGEGYAYTNPTYRIGMGSSILYTLSTGTSQTLKPNRGSNMNLMAVNSRITQTFTIKFYVDGSVNSTQTINYGAKVTQPQNPTKTGYTFNGWYKESTFQNQFDFNTIITQNYNLYAKFTINTSTVTFYKYSGGDVVDTQAVSYGDNAVAPLDPTRTGYDFTGWDKPLTNIIQNTNIYGTWSKKVYQVKFYKEGSLIETQNVEYQNKATKPTDPTKTGYDFDSWRIGSVSGSAFNFNTQITQNYNLYAKFTIKTFEVKYYKDSDWLKTITVNWNTTVNASDIPANPSKTGYTFKEWDFDATTTPITENKNIYAVWNINYYNVNFYKWNGGPKIGETQSIAYGSSATAPANPDKEGYNWKGWDKSFTNIVEDTNVYGTWEIKKFNVRFFNYSGGTQIGDTQVVDWNQNAIAPADPTRIDYDFAGWDKSYNNIRANTDIYGTWTIKTFEVKFYKWEGGELLKTQTVNYGSGATPPSYGTREYYTWNGWSGTYTGVTSNRNIYGTWTKNKYTVNFYYYTGGNLYKTYQVEYQASAPTPPTPTRTGYIFKQWDKSYNNIQGNLNVYGEWDVARKVTLLGNGGLYGVNTSKEIYVADGTLITNITNNPNNIPTREHYIFNKYYDTQEVTTKHSNTANASILEFINWFILGSPETMDQIESWSRPYCYSIIRDILSLNTTFKEYSILNTSGGNWNISLANSSYTAYDGSNYKQDGNITFRTNSANINALKNTSYYNSSTNSLVIPNGYYLEIIAASDETSSPYSNDFRFSFAVEELQEITVITEDITLYANYKFDPTNVSILGSATYNSATYQPFEYGSVSGVIYLIPESITPDLTITNNIPSRETVNKYFKEERETSGKITNNFISSNPDLSVRQNSSEITYLIQGDNITNRILTIAHSSSLVWEDTGWIGPVQGYNITVNLSIGNKTITKTYPVTWNNTHISYNSQGNPNLFVTNVSEIFQIDLSNETEAVWNSVLNDLGSKKLGSPTVIIKKEIKGNNKTINGTYIDNDIQSVNGNSQEMLETGFIEGFGNLYTPTIFGLKVTGYLYLNTKNKEPLTKVLYEGNNLNCS